MNEQETIFGLDKPLDDCDFIYAQLSPQILEDDRPLWNLKWFDYRALHPIHATYLFADAYRTAYREAYARNFDRAKSEHVRGIKGEDIFDWTKKRSNDVTGFVRARQHADMMGMPYIEFCRIAIGWAMRRTRTYVPRPSHLYNFDLLTAIQETWLDRQKGQVFMAEGALFRNEVYQGLGVQDAHHEWLLQQAAMRSNADHYLATALYERDVLLESKVEARFGADALARARRLH